MVDRVDTNITHNTKIIANTLNYDNDMAILQQGSVRSTRRFFHELEHPDIPFPEDIKSTNNKSINNTISINSVGFVVKFVIFILLSMIVWDYLKTK
jgi:hypothetical protein